MSDHSSYVERQSKFKEVGIAGWVTGFSLLWPYWSLSMPIETPPGGKTFSLSCFHWLRPYLNIQLHSHTLRTHCKLKVLQCNLGLLWFLFIHSQFQQDWAPGTSVTLISALTGWRSAFMEAGMSCCQAPRHICWVCDSSAAGLDSVFSLSQIGGMSTDSQTRPVGPAIQLLVAVGEWADQHTLSKISYSGFCVNI